MLGIDRTPYEFFMQMPGHGWRIATHDLERAMAQSPSLHRQLLRYVQAAHVQASETAFANANSDVEARLVRWLMMCHDRERLEELADDAYGLSEAGLIHAMPLAGLLLSNLQKQSSPLPGPRPAPSIG